jgi:FAD/FMN-containing dehydrogenase
MPVSRRTFFTGVAAAAAVVAFDPLSKTWTASATPRGLQIPGLDGQLLLDPTSLGEAADDFGHIVHRTPTAVLKPASVKDIVTVVRFANQNGLKVAMRGQGHSRYGQAQALNGIVIDSSTLASIHEVSTKGAVVDPGVVWGDVVAAAVPQGLTPPVLNDWGGLTVCGIVSIGGFGGSSHRHGLQADNVLEVQVVTGLGDLVTCSPTCNRDLFNSVLGGLGQFGIIVRATVKLVPAATNVRWYRLSYTDRARFLRDQRAAVADERFHHLAGNAFLQPTGWTYTLDAASFYTPPAAPDDAVLLAGLAGTPKIVEMAYLDWTNRNNAGVAAQKQSGVWYWKHPWFDAFLPDSEADDYINDALDSLTTADTGGGPVIMFPFKASRVTRPFIARPDEDIAYVFGVYRVTPDAQVAADMVAHNRTLFEQARDVGGKKYPVDAIPSTPADWPEHFGDQWPAFVARKRRYDPRHVLAPGQGIFEPVT